MSRMCTVVAMMALVACGGYEEDKQLASESSAPIEAPGAPEKFAVNSTSACDGLP
jgi:hypothetical protein